ncbi:hypothetical protein GCM10010261_16630 [Streptomyces pilosus]|uniref:Fe/B12 periplasmic-binding domain-containing protein n=1 Tax=Streptomyces pilosus TaxID=28893 RepID=A0A918BKS8_9ACTN|nr:hypothetical protein GCM10010280_23090 [Streptomyces pilosus]GGV43383.1 hypothetical protein GCM10010261_16630 [Streptomyces pilosus]
MGGSPGRDPRTRSPTVAKLPTIAVDGAPRPEPPPRPRQAHGPTRGTSPRNRKRAFLKSYEPLANVSAVRNDRIVVLDHADLVESPRNPAAVESLAARLRNAGS